MTFLNSESLRTELMIVSRGHGRGHAVPDIALASALTSLIPDLRLAFVSYGAGAVAYKERGYEVIDLQRPDFPPFLDMVVDYIRLLAKTTPYLILAHEEIPVLPAAKAFTIPCVFITDFFMDPSGVSMQALRFADEIIFTAQSGLFTEPPHLQGKVHYVGRAIRQFEYTREDRKRARCELKIPENALVVLCQPGSWPESQVPLFPLLSRAWDLLPHSPKLLNWIGGSDYEHLCVRFRARPDVVILKEDPKIDRLMAAADVLITKANRMTVYEAAAIGLPSVSISSLVNWPDDVAVASVHSNTALLADSTTPEELSRLITEKAAAILPADSENSKGIAGAAARVASRINRLRAQP